MHLVFEVCEGGELLTHMIGTDEVTWKLLEAVFRHLGQVGRPRGRKGDLRSLLEEEGKPHLEEGSLLEQGSLQEGQLLSLIHI